MACCSEAAATRRTCELRQAARFARLLAADKSSISRARRDAANTAAGQRRHCDQRRRSGPCAKFLQQDVTLLRVVAVRLLLGTGGAMPLVYLNPTAQMANARLQPGS